MTNDLPCIALLRPSIVMNAFSMPNPPLGLGYLASYLEREGYKVYIIDLTVRRITENTLVEFIRKKNPVLIGISALTAYYNGMRDLSHVIKKRMPGVPIALGGVHVSMLPEVSLEECHADFVIEGEGEETLRELVSALMKDSKKFKDLLPEIKGLYYRNDEGVTTYTGKRDLIKDLDSLPMPAWDKIKPSLYPPEPNGFIYKHSKFAPVLSTRGCPFSCHYCASCNFWRRRIRFRSPKNVVDEIEYLHDRFGIKEIHFWDDNLTLKRAHIVGICREIIQRGLNKMAFSTPSGVRVDTLDEDLMKLMRAAGFYYLSFAVESGSMEVLKKTGKFTDLKKIARNAFIAKKLGFDLNSFFLIGLPADTVESIKKTIHFAKCIPFDMKSFFLAKPLPGSRIFDKWRGEQSLKGYDWSVMNFFHPDAQVSNIDLEILESLQSKAIHETLLTIRMFPRFLFFRLVKYMHFKQLGMLVKRLAWFFFGFMAFPDR